MRPRRRGLSARDARIGSQELAVGADTGTQQAAPNTGALDPDRVIREVDATVYAAPVQSHLRVTLTPLLTLK